MLTLTDMLQTRKVKDVDEFHLPTTDVDGVWLRNALKNSSSHADFTDKTVSHPAMRKGTTEQYVIPLLGLPFFVLRDDKGSLNLDPKFFSFGYTFSERRNGVRIEDFTEEEYRKCGYRSCCFEGGCK